MSAPTSDAHAFADQGEFSIRNVITLYELVVQYPSASWSPRPEAIKASQVIQELPDHWQALISNATQAGLVQRSRAGSFDDELQRETQTVLSATALVFCSTIVRLGLICSR